MGAADRAAVTQAVTERLRAAGCVFAEEEAALLVEQSATDRDLHTLVARRCAGEPLEQVLGWVDFAGLRLTLSPGVFVPRQRSRLLVDQAVARGWPGCLVLDMCCGSGALGAAVAAALGAVTLVATDIDPVAVACAQTNIQPWRGRALVSDLDAALPPDLAGRVDLLVVNAPYVPTGAIRLLPPEARDHEPLRALDGGGDGVDVHRRVAALASRWLSPTGTLLVETSQEQARATEAAVRSAGLLALLAAEADDGTAVVAGHLMSG